MKNYKLGVLGLSETRWLQSRQLRLSSGEQLLYSGHAEDGASHTESVALMLAPEAHAALIGWEPVNSRIITAKFTTKKKDIGLNIIQCYAPTNDAEEEKTDDFHQQLQAVLDRRGAKDITILMGNFNAKIGMDNTGYEGMGTHGLGQMNKNGERFADLCALNQLVIGGSIRNKDTQAAFQISLSNRFQPLQELTEDDETHIETQWEHCKKLWHDICEEVLGKKKT